MLQQRNKSIGLDNLVKNLHNSKKSNKKEITSAEYVEKLMSTMNDSEFGQESVNGTNVNGMSKSIGSPSSPSSLSSASSTTSNHSSASSSTNQQATLQAAIQALMHQQQSTTVPNMGLLTSQQDKSNTMQAMQQQQQLNQLLASIAAAQQQQNSPSHNTNALLNNLMQQQLDTTSQKKHKLPKLNVKTKQSRSIKGNSVSPPGTSSSCSDDQEVHSPDSENHNIKPEPMYEPPMDTKDPIKSEDCDENDLDRSTNSSASQDMDRPHHHDQDNDHDQDELDDYEHSFSRDSKRHRNHSTSSPTRSTSSNAHSRSTSPSTTSYHDSPAAFPNLESATAMLGGLNCTPGGTLNFLDTSMGESGKKRCGKGSNDSLNKKIKPVPNDKKDDAYWERRRKNNEAAKRSRDLRRQKEDSIAVKATILEQENLKLKAQVTILKAELSKLHFMLYNR